MDLGSIFIGLAFTLMAAAFIIKPILERAGTSITETERRLSTLQAERDRVLAAIEELEMDQTMGKVAQEDFQAQRRELLTRGVEILREQDELDLRRIERDTGDVAYSALESEFEAAVAKLRGSDVEPSTTFCGACGAKIVVGDRFCVNCGEAVHAVEDLA
jgi:hypothetical protein